MRRVSAWRRLSRGIRALVRPSAAEREAADEIEHFLEEAAAAHRARGLSRPEAIRAARLELGSVTSVQQQLREVGWENLVATSLADLRYAARRLRSAPGFTALAVATLGLGIGSATAIFGAIHPILIEPLPYPEADRVAMVWDTGADGTRLDVTYGTFLELVERNRSFEAMAASKPWRPTLIGATEPERLDGQRVSWSYFRVLGVAPALGEAFRPALDRLDGPWVVILGDALWRRRFEADPAILGRPITLDGNPYVVAGVMPEAFENVLAPGTEIWTPLQYDLSQGRAWGHHLRLVGRLAAGVGIDRARSDLAAIAQAPVAEFPRPPWAALDQGLRVIPLQEDLTRSVRPALLALLGAVTLLLVIAGVNVTNLLLARAAYRGGELALRAALGAGRGRLVRQLLTESLLLAAMGGAAGVAVALAGVRALAALGPADLPRADAIAVDGAALAFALAVTTLIGIACGLVPALEASPAPHRGLAHASPRAAGGHRRTRSALVVAEVGLALVLLVASGLLLRSFERLCAVATGFDPSHLLTLQVQTSGQRFDGDGTTRRFFAEALAAVQQVPGVTAAALTSQLPLSGDADLYGVHFESASPDDPGEVRGTFRYAVSPGYFETLRIPLRRGRLLDERDREDAPPVAVISESLARRRLPGLDPIGRRLRIGEGLPYTVVGVVGDVKQTSLALDETDAVYVTAAQWRFADRAMSLVVRARGDATALVPAVRRAVWSVDEEQPIVRVATMEDLVAASEAKRRFALIVFEAFALAALALAAAGIYGVLAGAVAERRREIGVRSALGATRLDVLALVVRQGMTLTALGIALGLAGAAAGSRAIAALLYGVSHLDPLTYLGVIALLAAVATGACAVPAWRAARVDPATTLRTE